MPVGRRSIGRSKEDGWMGTEKPAEYSRMEKLATARRRQGRVRALVMLTCGPWWWWSSKFISLTLNYLVDDDLWSKVSM